MPKVPFWVFILIAVLYFSAVRVNTMDVDASQYAEMSREMMKSNDFLHLYDRGIDYLDKPPFLFWASALSMKVFGANNFGYKFPSLLFALWALFATYRLAKLLYGEVTGRMAALVLATCQGMFLMANDIRCDTILMSWVITSIWLIREWYARCKPVYLLAAFAAVGFGMMTKGPIALMVPVFCFSCDWALKREWKNFFRPAYLLGLVVIAIILVPMSIGLYQQFDMHPEKVVNGKTAVSGLRFFYWSQSFGRITGESPWKNAVYPTFLLENMLWSFLPWIVLFLPAMLLNAIELVRQKFRLQPGQEWITTGGFFITYMALGSSAYQLPHYIFIVFPLAAIVTARFMFQLIEENRYPIIYTIMKPLHAAIAFILMLAALALIVYVFPAHSALIAVWAAGFLTLIFLAFRRQLRGKLLWLCAASMIMVNVFVTNHLYPTLLQYQLGSAVGNYIAENSLPTQKVLIYNVDDPLNSIDFYSQGRIYFVNSLDSIGLHLKGSESVPGKMVMEGLDYPFYLLTMQPGLNDINTKGFRYSILKQGEFYKVSELTPEFLNPKTRHTTTKTYYFVKVIGWSGNVALASGEAGINQIQIH